MSSAKYILLDNLKKLKRELYTDIPYYINLFNSRKSVVSEIFDNDDFSAAYQNIDIQFPRLNSSNTWQAAYSNSVSIYEAFGKNSFPLGIALDEKFWAYLAFTEYWEYMQKRWPLDQDNYLTRLKNRYFFGQNPERRNELARFFWIAHITYLEGKDNPYELTKIAFEFADPSSAIIERNIGRSPKTVRASMIAIKNNINHPKIKNRKYFGRFAKEVNKIAGTIIIDFLTEKELEDWFTILLRFELTN